MSINRPSSRKSNTLNSSASSRVQDDNLSSARQRQSKRDDAIRKKAEQDLKKRKSPKHSTSLQKNSRRVPGTVSALKPSPALTVRSNINVTEASQMMAAKRADCVLVVDEDEHLAGIFTAKDLAYRVVAEGLDARATLVSSIMTPNPLCVTSDASATDALNTMVQRGFRHLPVCNEEGDVVGLLDITKCLYDALDKMDRAYGSSRKLYDALESVDKEWSMQAPHLMQLMTNLKDQMNCPDVTTVLDGSVPADVTPRSTVRDAARAMKDHHTTAVLVMENDGIAGIFTSKDVVLRVIAAQLDPNNCSVIRVMTPHPDTALPETTILDALKRMHHGHYLNLPIVDDMKQVIGMVDVLKLTYATLEQINNIQGDGSDANPMWNKFWSTAFAEDNESYISEQTTNQPAGSDVYPHESVSAVDEDTAHSDHTYRTFTFKFKSPSGKVYRFNSSTQDFFRLRDTIVNKLLEEDPTTIPSDIPPLCYDDDEGDQVLLTKDEDLADAIQLARQNGWHRLILHLVEDPEQDTYVEPVASRHIESPAPIVQSRTQEPPAPVAEPVQATELKLEPVAPPTPQPKKEDPLVPDHLLIPVAIGSGLLVALVGIIIAMRVSSK